MNHRKHQQRARQRQAKKLADMTARAHEYLKAATYWRDAEREAARTAWAEAEEQFRMRTAALEAQNARMMELLTSQAMLHPAPVIVRTDGEGKLSLSA